MKLSVQKITPPTHIGYETPLYLISHYEPVIDSNLVLGRHHLTLRNVFRIGEEYHLLDREYPALLIDLKDDANGEKCSRITLVFDPDVAKEIFVVR